MTVNSRKFASLLVVLGLSLTALGFAFAAAGSFPTVSAPDSACVGETIPISATSDSSGLRLVVEDADGVVLYDSDEDPGAEEQIDPAGIGLFSLDKLFTIPLDASGPLTVKATDGLGRESSKTVDIN